MACLAADRARDDEIDLVRLSQRAPRNAALNRCHGRIKVQTLLLTCYSAKWKLRTGDVEEVLAALVGKDAPPEICTGR